MSLPAPLLSSWFGCNINYQTGESVFHQDIQTLTRELKILQAVEYFGQNFRCLESDETLPQVVDVSALKTKARSK